MDTEKVSVLTHYFIPNADYPKIKEALRQIQANPKNTLMHNYADLDEAMYNLQDLYRSGLVQSFYLGTILVGILVFDVVKYWWSPRRFLYETMVLNVDKNFHGFGRIAVRQLEKLAAKYSCAAICSGCMVDTNVPIVRNLYKKFGFKIDTSNFIKELDE